MRFRAWYSRSITSSPVFQPFSIRSSLSFLAKSSCLLIFSKLFRSTAALPLNAPASQKNLNELINYAFWLSIPTKQDKNLTFESLQSQIQLLKPAIIQTKSYAENHLKSQIATILEERYLYPEKLPPLSLLNSTGITNYITQIEDSYLAYYPPQEAFSSRTWK